MCLDNRRQWGNSSEILSRVILIPEASQAKGQNKDIFRPAKSQTFYLKKITWGYTPEKQTNKKGICRNKQRPAKWDQAKVIYAELTRESATIACVLVETQRQVEE